MTDCCAPSMNRDRAFAETVTSLCYKMLVGLWFCITATLVQADGLATLQDFLQHSRSGRFDFVQQVTGPKRTGQNPRVKTSRGTLAYQRPDLFRLDYTAPDAQTFLADGHEFWHLDHELLQVTVRTQKSVQASAPATLILTASDLTSLQTAFELRSLPAAQGLQWVEVTPKTPEGTLRQLRVGLSGSGKTSTVSILEFVDGLGQTTKLELSPIESPSRLPPDTFQVKVPPSHKVIRP